MDEPLRFPGYRPVRPLRTHLRTLQTAILVEDLRWMRFPIVVSLTLPATLGDHDPEIEISHRLRPDPETFSAPFVFFLTDWMFVLHREILSDLHREAASRVPREVGRAPSRW